MSTGASTGKIPPYDSSSSHISAGVLPGQPLMLQPSPVSTANAANGASSTIRASQGPFESQPSNYSTVVAPTGAHYVTLSQSGQAATQPKPTATGLSINSKYLKTWQCALRIARAGTSLAGLISSALTTSSYWALFPFGALPSGHAFSLATAVMAFICNCGWLIFYLLSFNARWPVAARRAVTAYNIVEMIFTFAAVTRIQAYVELGLINVAVCSIELYLNIAWWKGGPELINLPFGTANSPDIEIQQQQPKPQPQPQEQMQQQQQQQLQRNQ